MNPSGAYCSHGRHQVASNCKVAGDRHGSYLVYQDAPVPWGELGRGVKLDFSSTLETALDIFIFSTISWSEWTVNMFRNGLKYLLAGAAVPHVLSSVLQPTPPMG
jgi:hypothetical protein